MEVSGQLHAPAASLPGKELQYPLDRRLCGPQSRSERGEEKNSQPLSGLEPPIIQPAAQFKYSVLASHTYTCLHKTQRIKV
jgi:hypothetical protein